ncbi:MAG: sugar phosphate isomerase/epimerase [Solirubrobacterales bacterium]
MILAAPALVPHRDPLGAARIRGLVDAAADAGFEGMSIWTAHHDWAVADGAGAEDFFDWHRERGLTMPAAEVVLDWAPADPAAVADSCGHLLDVAARAGSRTVIAVTLDPKPPEIGRAVAGLRALCELAADRGLAVSFEFLPWTGVPTIAAVRDLIEATDRENLGLVLDAWHWFRQPGGPDLATLLAFPAERIHVLQLDDAPARAAADLPLETSTARLLPGEGDVDLLGLLAAVAATGASPLVVSEVFSLPLAELDPGENARRQYAAAAALMTRHREAAAAAGARSL